MFVAIIFIERKKRKPSEYLEGNDLGEKGRREGREPRIQAIEHDTCLARKNEVARLFGKMSVISNDKKSDTKQYI